MCFQCPEHGPQSSLAGTVKGALVTIAVLGLVGGTYRVMEIVWPLYLALLIAGYLWVYAAQPIRRLARHIKGLRDARRATAAPAEYNAVLAVTHNGQTRMLMSGPVPGQWKSAEDVTAAITARYVAAFGQPAGELTCSAEPVGALTR